jgi:hypothetical protein
MQLWLCDILNNRRKPAQSVSEFIANGVLRTAFVCARSFLLFSKVTRETGPARAALLSAAVLLSTTQFLILSKQRHGWQVTPMDKIVRLSQWQFWRVPCEKISCNDPLALSRYSHGLLAGTAGVRFPAGTNLGSEVHPEDIGCCFPWGNWTLGFTQPLTEMSTRNIKIIMFWGSKVRWMRRADNLTTIWADCLDNVGSLPSHNPIGLHGLLRG